MSLLGIILLVILLVLVFGGLPHWGWHGGSYGYYPSGLFGILLIVLIILVVTGRL